MNKNIYPSIQENKETFELKIETRANPGKLKLPTFEFT